MGKLPRNASQPRLRARARNQDTALAMRYSCAGHQLTYLVPSGVSEQCPLCDAERRINDLQGALYETNNRLELATNELERLRVQVDVVAAIREALKVTELDDLVFLKTVLYRWREDKSISLKVMHRGRGPRRQASGFIAIPRGGAEPEGHECTSVGGAAIAGYYEEALHMAGGPHAMSMLIRGMGELLRGGLD